MADPGVTFTITLPMETYSALQRGNGIDQALQILSVNPTSPNRIILDIARRAVRSVRSHSYQVVEKANSLPTSYGSSVLIPPTTAPGDGASYKEYEDHEDNIYTIQDVEPAQEGFEMQQEDTFRRLADSYANRRNECKPFGKKDYFQASDFTFQVPTKRYGTLMLDIDSEMCSWKISKLTINGVVLAHPRQITVTIFNVEHCDEERIVLPANSTVHRLEHEYNLRIMTPAKFALKFPGGDIFTGHNDWITLAEKGISNGTVLHACTPPSPVYWINLTIRDAMNRETKLCVKNNSTTDELEELYTDETGLHTGSLLFEVNGTDFGIGLTFGSTFLSSYGIVDGAVINVRPLPNPAPKTNDDGSGWGCSRQSQQGGDTTSRPRSASPQGWGRPLSPSSAFGNQGWGSGRDWGAGSVAGSNMSAPHSPISSPCRVIDTAIFNFSDDAPPRFGCGTSSALGSLVNEAPTAKYANDGRYRANTPAPERPAPHTHRAEDLITKNDLFAAYRYLNIPVNEANSLSDDRTIELFRAQLPDLSVRAGKEACSALYKIGLFRSSSKLMGESHRAKRDEFGSSLFD